MVKNQYNENEKEAVARSSVHSLSEVLNKEPEKVQRVNFPSFEKERLVLLQHESPKHLK